MSQPKEKKTKTAPSTKRTPLPHISNPDDVTVKSASLPPPPPSQGSVKPAVGGKSPNTEPPLAAVNFDFLRSSPSAPLPPISQPLRSSNDAYDPDGEHRMYLSPTNSEGLQSPAASDDGELDLESCDIMKSIQTFFSYLVMALIVTILISLVSYSAPQPLSLHPSKYSAASDSSFFSQEKKRLILLKINATAALRANVTANVTALTPTPLVPLTHLVETPPHHRHFYLRYDSPNPVPMFDCAKFPPQEHKIFNEFYYLNADGTMPRFYRQQVLPGSHLFLSCPASRPRLFILWAKFGRFYGDDQATGEPMHFVHDWGGQLTTFEFTEGLRERCGSDKRFCCVNKVEWPFESKEIGQVSWTCEKGEVKQEGDKVQHGSIEIYKSQMSVLANLHGTSMYPAATAAVSHPPELSNATLNDTFRCTFSLHQSPHSWDNGGQANGQGGGFIHQLSSLTATIGMSALGRCDINSEGFYPDFDLLHAVPLGLVIDLPKLNAHLAENSMFVGVRDKFLDTHIYPFSAMPAGMPYAGIMMNDMKNAPEGQLDKTPHKELREGKAPSALYLVGHLFPFWMNDDTAHHARLRNTVVGHMPFTKPFMQAAEEIMKGLNLTSGDFVTIHFRLEPDSKEFAARQSQSADAYRESIFNRIVDVLQKRQVSKNARIYLSTGLNSEDSYVQKLKSLYPNAVTKDMILDDCKTTKDVPAEVQNAAASNQLRQSRWNPVTHPVLHALSQIPWTAQTDECGLIRGDRFENREYWAVLDWIVSSECKFFVAAPQSLYSQMMDRIIQSQPKTWPDTQTTQTSASI